MLLTPFKLYDRYVTKKALEGYGDFKVGGQIIHTVKYADKLVLLAKEEMVLYSMTDKLVEIGRCYELEMKVEKSKVMRISRQPSQVQIIKDKKQLDYKRSKTAGECGILQLSC